MITIEHNRFQRVGCVLIPLVEVGRVRDRADGSPCAGRERCGTRAAARPRPRANVGGTRSRASARTRAPGRPSGLGEPRGRTGRRSECPCQRGPFRRGCRPEHHVRVQRVRRHSAVRLCVDPQRRGHRDGSDGHPLVRVAGNLRRDVHRHRRPPGNRDGVEERRHQPASFRGRLGRSQSRGSGNGAHVQRISLGRRWFVLV